MYLEDFQAKLTWHTPTIALAILIPISIQNSLFFHTLVEGFAIVVAILIFVVSYSTYSYSRSHYLMFLGCGYFWVAILDFCHVSTFSVLSIFPNTTTSMTIQFWMVARAMEVFVLICFTNFIDKPVHRKVLFWSFGIVFMLFFLFILSGVFPILYSSENGLSQTKIVGEYILIALLLVAGWRIRKVKNRLNYSVYKLLSLSIALTILAETFFTLYSDFTGVLFITGHIFKLASFWVIYVALIESTLKQPFKSLKLSSDTFNALPDAITVVDTSGKILHANQSAYHFSEDQQRLVGASVHQIFHNAEFSADDCSICAAIKNNRFYEYQEAKIDSRWYEITLSNISTSPQNNVVLQVSRDISLRKEAKAQLKIVERLYKVLRMTNKAIISSKSKQDLLESVCNIAAEYGGFSMAWIGMIEGNQVVPVSSAGDTHGYLKNIKVRVDDSALARGPVGIAANNQQVAFVNNIETDASFLPWREPAIKCGYRSLAAIPVIKDKESIGVFAIYSNEFDAFDSQVLELLSSLSDDILSITTFIRAEEKRVKAEQKLKQLSRAIEQSKSAIVISNLEGIIEYVNPYFAELMGYSENEILSMNIFDFPRPEVTKKH